MDWEPLAKFRAACGPELAELVAEELAFARQHGTRGFHWTGAGFALQDGLVCWTETGMDGRTVECAAEIAPLGENIRLKWAVHRHWTEIPGEYADDFFDIEGDIFL